MTYSLQGLGTAGSVAGPINGVATLAYDIKRSAESAVAAFGSEVSFDRGDYQRLLRQAKNDPSSIQDQQVPTARLRNFVYGVIGDVASAVARAQQLAQIQVSGDPARAENHRIQAELIGAGRLMLDSANTAIRNVTPVPAGTSGLGNPLVVVGVIAAAALVYAIVGVSVVAAIALCYDSQQRMVSARASADRACEAQGGCDAAEYTRIVQRLQLGPLDTLAGGGGAALAAAGMAPLTIALVVGGSAVGLGALWFLFGTAAGRRTLKGLREETKK